MLLSVCLDWLPLAIYICLVFGGLGSGASAKRVYFGYSAFRAGMHSLHIRGGDTTIAARLLSTRFTQYMHRCRESCPAADARGWACYYE